MSVTNMKRNANIVVTSATFILLQFVYNVHIPGTIRSNIIANLIARLDNLIALIVLFLYKQIIIMHATVAPHLVMSSIRSFYEIMI